MKYDYPVIIGMACLPDRYKETVKAVESLVKQCDQIYPIVNQKGEQRDVVKLQDKLVELTGWCGIGNNIKGDAEKFRGLMEHRAFLQANNRNPEFYYLTCDDDIIYPWDYVGWMIQGIEEHNQDALCSFHGREIDINKNHRIPSYHKCYKKRYHCGNETTAGGKIHIPGTGVGGFHSSLFPTLSIKDFKTANMADLWLGKYCNDRHIPVHCLPHKMEWIKVQDVSGTIFSQHAQLYKQMNGILNSTTWRRL